VDPQEVTPDQQATVRTNFFRSHLPAVAAILTCGGIALFAYFVYSTGVGDIAANIATFGWAGFAVLVAIYSMRIVMRALAWKLSVYEPYHLSLKDTIPAVIIGEAMSSMIPLGILISGTAKAVAVRKKVPLVVGLSSVATENLFYSITTSVFLILGALTLVRGFALDEGTTITIDVLIGLIAAIVTFLILLIVRQWHFASETCEAIYRRGWLTGILESGRLQVRLFENLIYGFYRRHPNRFLPICLTEAAFHALGVLEVWFILTRIVEPAGQFLNAFLLESVSRLITIVFKLIPLVIGVDEAGAQFVAETVGLGAAIGVTLAIIRKGRILFWTGIGLLLIVKRGLSLREIRRVSE
jgi:hypothetical protein